MTIKTLIEEFHNHDEIDNISYRLIKLIHYYMNNPNRKEVELNISSYFPNQPFKVLFNMSIDTEPGDEVKASAGATDTINILAINITIPKLFLLRKYQNNKHLIESLFWKQIHHEVIHIFDFIKSKGKARGKYSLELPKYYESEQEFNQVVNNIASAARHDLDFFRHMARYKNGLLSYIEEVEPRFHYAIMEYPKFYTKFLKRLIREKLLLKEPQ